MKKKLFCLAFLFSVITISYAQTSNQRYVLFREHKFVAPATAELAFASPLKPSSPYYNGTTLGEDDSYKRGRGYKMARSERNMGIAGLAVGGAFMILGSALLADGVHTYRSNGGGIANPDNVGSFYEAYAGAVFLVAGTGLVIPGGIFTAKGVRHLARLREAHANGN
jgi:hypothetical protein